MGYHASVSGLEGGEWGLHLCIYTSQFQDICRCQIDKLTKENAGLEAKVKEMEFEFPAISVDAVN